MNKRNNTWLACVCIFAVIFCLLSFSSFREVIETRRALATPLENATAGTPRNVDERRMKQLIEAGKLSDREALFYHPEPLPVP